MIAIKGKLYEKLEEIVMNSPRLENLMKPHFKSMDYKLIVHGLETAKLQWFSLGLLAVIDLMLNS